MSITTARPETVRIEDIAFLESDNPNRMSDDKYEQLKKNIKTYGFFQPVLVYRSETGHTFRLVDGFHRLKAMKELGEEEILCVVADSLDVAREIQPRVMRLAMNNLRGNAPYEALTRELQALLEEGVQMGELPDSGVLEADISALLAADSINLEEVLEAGNSPSDVIDEPEQTSFFVTVKCSSREKKMMLESALQNQAAADNSRPDTYLASLLGL